MLQPRTFDPALVCDAMSPGTLESHFRLYTGYVHKYNELMEKFHTIQRRGPAATAEIGSLRGDIAFALGAVRNHELYFESLTADGHEPEGPLAELIVKSFHSVPQYLTDLKQTAPHGRGWVWTVYDLDHHHLFNYEAAAGGGLPVWNTVPILAIDLFGHAYFYDFGNNKTAYIEAVMKSLNWPTIGQRLRTAQNL